MPAALDGFKAFKIFNIFSGDVSADSLYERPFLQKAKYGNNEILKIMFLKWLNFI